MSASEDTLTPADLDRLEAVADAAFPDNWTEGDILGKVSPSQIDGFIWPETRRHHQNVIAADTAHIATFDPPTVKALIALARAGARALDRGQTADIISSRIEHPGFNAYDLADALIADIAAPEATEGENR